MNAVAMSSSSRSFVSPVGDDIEHSREFSNSLPAEPETEQTPSQQHRFAAQPTFENDAAVGVDGAPTAPRFFPDGSPMQRFSQSHTPQDTDGGPLPGAPRTSNSDSIPAGLSAEEEQRYLEMRREEAGAAKIRMQEEIALKDELLHHLASLEDAALDVHSSNADIMAHNAELQKEVEELKRQIAAAKEEAEAVLPKEAELKELLGQQREANDALLDEMTALEKENLEWETELQTLDRQKDVSGRPSGLAQPAWLIRSPRDLSPPVCPGLSPSIVWVTGVPPQEERRSNMKLLADLARIKPAGGGDLVGGGGGADGVQQQVQALQHENDALLGELARLQAQKDQHAGVHEAVGMQLADAVPLRRCHSTGRRRSCLLLVRPLWRHRW